MKCMVCGSPRTEDISACPACGFPYIKTVGRDPRSERMLHQYAEPDAASMNMLRMAMERLKLSARAYSRILKVARTIADLDNSENVQSHHIAEAIGYRNLDRGDWAERGV